MVSEDEGVFDTDDVSTASECCAEFKNVYFHKALLEKPALILNDFDTAVHFILMVENFDRLAKGASSQIVHYLITIVDVVSQHYSIVALPIIKSTVWVSVCICSHFAPFLSQIENLFEVIDFHLFVLRQFFHKVHDCVFWGHGEIRFLLLFD